ncbi:MAG: B12-binding domain-containing radical SAM protein [Magnetospirillum sp. WYHS-4]
MSGNDVLRGLEAAEHVKPSFAEAKRPLTAVLILPPDWGAVGSLVARYSESGGIGFKPPQGILYVATALHAFSPHRAHVIDALAEGLSFEALARRVAELRPDVVGISAWTDWWWPAWRTGEAIKRSLPDTHLVYGGPHLGIYPQETLDHPFVDSVIVGDGEMPFLYLCNMLANGIKDPDFPGLHFKEHGIKPPPGTFFIQKDLDALPHPDRRLLPIRNYSSVLAKSAYVTTMITSRGCPHQCTFCKLNFQKTLSRSAESVAAEFAEIQALGIHEVEIYDDTFTSSRKRVEAICTQLIANGNRVEWAIRDRVNNADPELLALMRRAGCRRVHYGVESGSQAVLDLMRKHTTPDKARQAIRAAKDAGLTVLAFFMLGNVGETQDDMRTTIDFAVELDPDFAEFSITIPYPGTEMYRQCLADGTIQSDYWAAFARRPEENFRPPRLVESHATREQLVAMRNRAVRKFYLRPKYLWKALREVSSLGELTRKALMGLRLVNSAYTPFSPYSRRDQEP